MNAESTRKIIHVDMDCFYAAIEIRENPSLKEKPVAVGGSADERGVLCTCNYVARKFGVRSAMSTAYAKKLCPDLIVLPVNFSKYREAAEIIRHIFHEYTELVEPLSLDEAYLDVSQSSQFQGSATWIAESIRKKIWETVKLTASAGVAPNKFLAKIASGWNKPNGLFVLRPQDIQEFIQKLPVEELFGVGKVTAAKLHQAGFKTCADLQHWTLAQLTDHFGKFGIQLYEQSRGIDNRNVEPNRIRKSLSVERTFKEDILLNEQCFEILNDLYEELANRIQESEPDRAIKNQYLKIKFNNFKLSTVEKSCPALNLTEFKNLLSGNFNKEQPPVRLLGIGVHFAEQKPGPAFVQRELVIP